MANWKIDESHSMVNFRVQHIGLTWFSGDVFNVSGNLNYDEGNIESASVEVSIPASNVKTGNEARDGHLMAPDFFDVEKYPNITFKSKSIKKIDESKAIVLGDLTIKETTKEIELEIELSGVSERPNQTGGMDKVLGVHGKTEIDRTEFGLNWNMDLPGGKVVLGNKVKLEITVEAVTAK